MNRLRTRLIVAFLLATVLPLAATVWITTSLIDRSLGFATTGELDRLSRTLEETVRQFYQRERDALKQDVLAGRVTPTSYAVADEARWPDAVRAFWTSGEAERFGLSGTEGDHVEYLRRTEGDGASSRGVQTYSRDLHGLRMEQLSSQLRGTRQLVESIEGRDLRRGFTLTLLLLLGAAWIVSLAPLVLIAHRISKPIRQLTEGLTDFAAGDWSTRVETGRDPGAPPRDEVGSAVDAFNRMADQLRQSRERLVHLTQIASWQTLARKTAHEVKNSLTPIRLTVEEMQARLQPADRTFLDQAVQIVVSEIDALTQQWTNLEHQKDVLRADWRTQKPVLEQQLRLIERETAELTALLETTAAQRDEVEQRRLELLTEQTELEEESAALDASLAQASVILHSLQRDLPPPLSNAWVDELARLDNNVETSTNRFRKLIELLGQLEDFEAKITLNEAVMTLSDGQDHVVKQVYLGLSHGWYVTADQSFAAAGKPGPDGWLWTPVTDATPIANIVGILEQRIDADFVSIAFELAQPLNGAN